MVDKVDEFGHMDRIPVAFAFDKDQSCVSNYPREGFIGEPHLDRLSSEELLAFTNSLVRWNGKCMCSPLVNTPAWRDKIGISYIYTVSDLTVPVDYQKSMIDLMEKEGKAVETVELQAGHSPNLTATDEVVGAVVKFTSH